MMAIKVITILLEKERKDKRSKSESILYKYRLGVKITKSRSKRTLYKIYKKNYSSVY